MNLLKRAKRIWDISRKDKNSLEEFMRLKDSEIMDLPDEETKATFFDRGFEKEHKELNNQDKGLKGIFGLNNE